MSERRFRDLGLTYGPAAAVALLVIAVQLVHFGGLYAASDDSYIYLGYVKRALVPPRALFSYNPGEHSAGTTGILYYYMLVVAAAAVRAFTFTLPIATTLTVALYGLNAVLFVACAGLLARLVRMVTGGERVWEFVALALLLWSVKFLWGMFAGLENPLSAFLIMALVYALACGAPVTRIAVLAGLFIATRPELGPVLAVVPTFATVCARLPVRATNNPGGWRALAAWMRGTAWRAAGATILCAAVYAALVLPCFVTTGRIFPSALGTRVMIGALGDPQIFWQSIAAFDFGALWRNTWSMGSLVLMLGLVVVAPYRDVRVPLAAMAFVILQFGLRIALRLVEFSAEDRYVSYLWPLYVLAIVALLHALISTSRVATAALARPGVALAVCGALAAYTAVGPLREFDERFTADVREMNEVVVTPARWMQQHLPPSSRVAMEPAGAIRVFTDFYLIDAVGLTTTHVLPQESYADFMVANRADFAFDSPTRIPELGDPARYERLMSWSPRPRRHSWGEMGVFRLRSP
jgi:hypothetical protein